MLFLTLSQGVIFAKDPFVALPRHLATVGDDALAGNERRLVRSQEIDQICHVCRLPEPIEGNPSQVVLSKDPIFEQITVHRRIDESWKYRVDPDSRRAQFDRQAFASAPASPAFEASYAAARGLLESAFREETLTIAAL